MRIDESWPIKVASRGPVVGASIRWRRRSQLFVTVVAKLTLRYSADGVLEIDEPRDIGVDDGLGLSELAPQLPRCDVVLVGAPSGATRIRIERMGKSQLDKSSDAAAFAPTSAATTRVSGTLELSESHDFYCHHVAPDDLRVDYLQGDETLVLEGVDPERPRIELRLLRLRPRLRLVAGPETATLHCHLDSLGIDAANRRLVLLFRGSSPIATASILERTRAEVMVDPLGDEPPMSTNVPLGELDGTIALTAAAVSLPPVFGHTALADVTAAKKPATPFHGLRPPKPLNPLLAKTAPPMPTALRQTLPFASGARTGLATPAPPLAPPDISLSGGTVAVSRRASPTATPFDADPSDAAPDDAGPSALERAFENERAALRATQEAAAEEAHRAAEAAAEAAKLEAERAAAAQAEATALAEQAEKRREEAAARFAKEQREAEERVLAQRNAEKEKQRARTTQLKTKLYGFKKKG